MEEFINLDDYIKDNTSKKLYQIQLLNNYFIFKHIGNSNTNPPDMSIKENFGIDNSYNIYSLLYLEEELFDYKDKIIPLIKITNNKLNDKYSLCIKYNVVNFNENNHNYDLFFVYNIDNKVMCEPISKEDKQNINPDNIIEKLFELIIDIGVVLF
jgi:hypothetical protein